MPTNDALDLAQLRRAADVLRSTLKPGERWGAIDISSSTPLDHKESIATVLNALPQLLALAEAAQTLLDRTELVYQDREAREYTPIPTCVGCGRGGWGEIQHYPECPAVALRAALKELVS